MNRMEYREILNYELYGGEVYSFIKRMRIKYFSPNTNCMYLARKMWYHQSKGGSLSKVIANICYLKIFRRYGCCIFRTAEVGRGFYIAHPVGIVLGNCKIGENFCIYQNTTIGVNGFGTEGHPTIEDNCRLYAGAVAVGDIHITSNVQIGANSVVTRSIEEAGVYAGAPARRISK